MDCTMGRGDAVDGKGKGKSVLVRRGVHGDNERGDVLLRFGMEKLWLIQFGEPTGRG